MMGELRRLQLNAGASVMAHTANSQEPMFKTATLQIVIELTSDITRQLFACADSIALNSGQWRFAVDTAVLSLG